MLWEMYEKVLLSIKNICLKWCIRKSKLFYAQNMQCLTLKVPITTAADDKYCDIFSNFRKKYGMIFHENCLPADDSHEISCLI